MSQSIHDDVSKIPASDSKPNANERKSSRGPIEARAAATSLRPKPDRRSDKPNEPEYEGGEDEHIGDDDDLH
jgi:hypothetical protein